MRDNRGYVSGLMLLLVMRKGLMGEAEFTLSQMFVFERCQESQE